jgi:hypothetical protein
LGAGCWFPWGVKWLGQEADHSPLSSGEIKSEWDCTCTLVFALMLYLQTTLPYFAVFIKQLYVITISLCHRALLGALMNLWVYLGTLISNDNSVQKETQRRILVGNRTYFAVISLFRSRILSRATKILLYKTLIRPAVTYGAETWTMMKKEEHGVLIFERKIFRRIYGPKYEDGEWESRMNRELEEMSKGENIVKWIKGQRISWLGHLEKVEEDRMPKKIFTQELEGTR